MRETILITGASSGIGRAFATELAGQNRLILTGRDRVALEQTADLARTAGAAEVVCLAADLANNAARLSLLQQVRETTKETGIHKLILCAGAAKLGLFQEQSWAEHEQCLNLNVIANTHLCKELLPLLLHAAKASQKRSGLILISSHAAFMRVPRLTVYASSKGYLNQLGLGLYQELMHEPVDVLVVCPGATQSAFSQRTGLPQKMVSEPAPPETVVRATLESLGRRSLCIPKILDKCIYVAHKMVPTAMVDRLVSLYQQRLLQRSTSSSTLKTSESVSHEA